MDEQLIIDDVGATITGQDNVLVRDRASTSQKNLEAPHSSSLVAMEGNEWIPEEKAICRICFPKLGEENTVKSKCGCTVVLGHEECTTNRLSAIGNTECDRCRQKVNNTPVTLLRGCKFAQKIDPQDSTKRRWRSIGLERIPRSMKGSSRQPSLFRGRAYIERIKLPVEATSIGEHIKGHWSSAIQPSFTKRGADLKLKSLDVGTTITRGIVIVRDRDSASQTNPKVVMEGDKEIAEEEAICKICFSKLEDAALKSNCECGELLTHEKCVTNDKCHYCEQEANNIPVTLLRCLESAQPTNGHESTKSRRWWRLCS